MAIVTRKGGAITNLESKPIVLGNAFKSGAYKKEQIDSVDAVAGDSATSVYRLLKVPSGARVSELKLLCGALGAGAVVDIGVYYPASMPDNPSLAGTAIDADFFASAVDVSAALAETSIINESGTNTIAKRQMTLAEALGLDLNGLLGTTGADPQVELEICATVTVAIATSNPLALITSYCQ